jgi:hypothetical protein
LQVNLQLVLVYAVRHLNVFAKGMEQLLKCVPLLLYLRISGVLFQALVESFNGQLELLLLFKAKR